MQGVPKETCIERQVDSNGNIFCSDNCFEKFDSGLNDFSHPYIDWMKNYEGDLHKSVYFGCPKKTDLLEWLDGILAPYWGYYGLAGSDGVFFREIFFYINGLPELQETIRSWEVDERKYRKWLKELRT